MDANTREQLSGKSGFSDRDNRVGITGVYAEELGHVWQTVKPMLEKALAPNEIIDQVLTRLFLTSMQLWVAVEDGAIIAALTTEIVTENDRKRCNICHLGGTGMNNWLAYLPTIEEWAKAQGCASVKIPRGRMGWQRILKGYKPRTITLEKEL